MVGDANHADSDPIVGKHSLVLVVEPLVDPSGVQDSQRLLWQESVVPVHGVVVPRSAVDRARVGAVVFRRPVDQRMGVSAGRLDVEEVTAVDDGGSTDLACEITDLPQLIEHGVGPVVGTAGRCAVGQVYVCAPDKVDAHGDASPNKSMMVNCLVCPGGVSAMRSMSMMSSRTASSTLRI